MRTSSTEIKHIIIAWIAISIAFAIAIGGISKSFPLTVFISALTVGIGFLFHELGHKWLAQRYNCWAEFRADYRMLIFAVLLSFTGFLFAAPGGVFIAGRHVTREQNGKISFVGPAINFILALVFLPFVFSSSSMLHLIGRLGFQINAWLGLFNMIPFGPFDGAKVFYWSKPVWTAGIMALALLVFLSFTLI